MTLEQRIGDDYTTALRAGDEGRKNTLRLLRSSIKNETIDARKPLDDDGVVRVLRREAKQRRDSIEQFQSGGRADLVAAEQAELAVIESYLPSLLDDAAIEAAARRCIASLGASGPSEIGRVMSTLMKDLGGQADGKQVNATVRRLMGA
jgi:uncharacterized protein